MKVSVIHNTYRKNIFISETATLNIKALEESGVDYQYIIFNDHGDREVENDVKHLLNKKVQFVYSDINYGMGVCSGGWIGAIPYLEGDYVHNAGQDDVYTSLFYTSLIERLENPKIYLAYANGFKVNSNLTFQNQVLSPVQELDYSEPRRVFDFWFGRQGNTLTRANNFIPAPGVVYKKKIHDIIGIPNLENFKGSADFEYWARVLFNDLGVSYDPRPLWLYRISEYSLGIKPLAEKEILNWNSLILKKYQKCLMQSLQAEQVS